MKQTISFLTLFAIAITGLHTLAIAKEPQSEKQIEGELTPFLGEARFEMQQLFKTERFPNVAVALDGTVVVTWGNSAVRSRRSEDGGTTWSDEIIIAKPGFHGGGLTVDETSGDILAFVEEKHPPAPLTIYRSKDSGKTWRAETASIKPDSKGNAPSMHMNDHGITLRHGEHKCRLIRPSRYYGKVNNRSAWPSHYTNAIYSDDHGKTWQTSEPFPENGTGEATVAELSDGRLYYNSRVHWQERPKNTRRRAAWSSDGGHTWEDWRVVEILPDGHQHRSYGCMGGLVRLPVEGEDILLFSNLDTTKATRERVTVWASFDGGKTWPMKRLVFDGPSAYSSLNAGRPGTKSEGFIYLHFEGGPGGGSQVARFNLAWVLQGEATGDGEVPVELKKDDKRKIKPPTEEQVKSYKLDPKFYTKCISAADVLIATSDRVSDHAILEAAYQFEKIMESIKPEISTRIRETNVLCLLIGHDEFTSDLPQFATNKTGKELDFYNWRQRGFLTKKNGLQTVVFAEEDVLEYEGGMQIESILIHEFGHVIHGAGFDDVLQKRLTETFERARAKNIWMDGRAAQRFRRVKSKTPVSLLEALKKSFPDESPELLTACLQNGDITVNGKPVSAAVTVTVDDDVLIMFGGEKECYAHKNRAEYWAEGVQCWYNTNRTMDHDHNHIHTREQLKRYDPHLAKLCEDVLGDSPWRFVSPRMRAGKDHLTGFDPAKAPVATDLEHIQTAAYDYYDDYWKTYWSRLYEKHGLERESK